MSDNPEPWAKVIMNAAVTIISLILLSVIIIGLAS